MTKFSLFKPIQTLRFALTERLFAKIVLKAWTYGWFQILLGKRAKLWVPLPAIATHLDARALSPNFDWHALMNEEAEHIQSEGSGIKHSVSY